MLIYFDYKFLLIYLDLILMVLLSVAFLTLLERKVLWYIQLRKSPNKVGIMGIFQPFSDVIELFSKEFNLILKSNYFMYIISPFFLMMLMMMLWQFMPVFFKISNNSMSMMLIFCLMGMEVYPLMVAGWSSNSLYSLIGGLRSVAQTISYEVSMILIMLSVIFNIESLSFYKFYIFQKYAWFMFMNFL